MMVSHKAPPRLLIEHQLNAGQFSSAHSTKITDSTMGAVGKAKTVQNVIN